MKWLVVVLLLFVGLAGAGNTTPTHPVADSIAHPGIHLPV